MKDNKGGFFYSLLRGLNIIRLIILNLVFFFLLFICIALFRKYGETERAPHTAVSADSVLLLNPSGRLTEKADEFVWQNYLLEDTSDTVLLSDITEALVHAAHDRRITAVLFDLSALYGISAGHFPEFKTALLEYKASNKPLSVFSTRYGMGSYYIASFADYIYLDPMGELDLSGFYSESLFYGETEDKLGIQWNVIQAGTYKGMAETYSRTEMSDGVRSNYHAVFQDLWESYLQDIAENRGIERAQAERYAVRYTEALQEAQGSSVQAALNAHLITGMSTYEDCGVELGILDESYRFSSRDFIHYIDYNKAFKKRDTENKIGIIHLNGTITGSSTNESGNADSSVIMNLFDRAADDDSIKAVVLRIDSGGGEVAASEDIRRSVERLSKKAGKPVIVSMGAVAASGAYWIASAADYIFCSPYTITGSIGVLAVLPTVQQALKNYFGIRPDAVSVTGRHPYSLFRSLGADEKRQAELEIEHTYSVFLQTVARGRNLPLKTVEELAQGKIYSGSQAKAVQLADELGSFSDAVSYAATKAGIQENYSLKLLYKEPPLTDRFLKSLLTENIRLYSAADRAVLYEMLQLRSKKGFYVYSPVRPLLDD
ncbi:MAG: signal peptide peptidase SppA [Treponema sp.]